MYKFCVSQVSKLNTTKRNYIKVYGTDEKGHYLVTSQVSRLQKET